MDEIEKFQTCIEDTMSPEELQQKLEEQEQTISEEELNLFDGLIAEYELRAKYNDDVRDYKVYSMLVNARGILAEHKLP